MATFGNENVEATDIAVGVAVYACHYSLLEAGTITNIAVYIHEINNWSLICGIYSDGAGVPDALLGITAEHAPTAPDTWVECDGDDLPLLLAPGDYWLAVQGHGNLYRGNAAGAHPTRYDGAVYPNFNAPWTDDGGTTPDLSIHADYTPSAGVSKKRMLMGVGLAAKTPKFTARKVVPWKCPLPLFK